MTRTHGQSKTRLYNCWRAMDRPTSNKISADARGPGGLASLEVLRFVAGGCAPASTFHYRNDGGTRRHFYGNWEKLPP